MLKFGLSSVIHGDVDKLKSKVSVVSLKMPMPTQGLELAPFDRASPSV